MTPVASSVRLLGWEEAAVAVADSRMSDCHPAPTARSVFVILAAVVEVVALAMVWSYLTVWVEAQAA